ncbi:carboxypeptidase regulatory-like domain-containing protein [Hymenobacter glacieicola]|uniref:carboxypeptidase regulatory-like domain-containing protein n=1 Tax=Hymenobacter glacieicola TaxID=1562124 RepID=UPI00166BA6EF|nr:carboxypeptidase regulatory-like domain-containing protein [Hymenobacter glacieicola]
MLLFPLAVGQSYAQPTTTITGRVTDETGSGIPGVTVLLKGSATGTATRPDGSCSVQPRRR